MWIMGLLIISIGVLVILYCVLEGIKSAFEYAGVDKPLLIIGIMGCLVGILICMFGMILI